MTELTGMTPAELTEWAKEHGLPAFRGRQLFQWIHRGADFEEMTNLPAALRERLKESAVAQPVRILEEKRSSLDDTVKFLLGMRDDNCVEAVLMHYHYGWSLCISTQVGCRMGCTFCASTIGGRERNLTAAEMLEQVYRICEDTGERVSNVVIMGTGEPMDNLENVERFLELISSDKGMNISRRNITVSSCGLVEKIRAFADREPEATLAISLHAPTDELRKKIMPIANKYSVAEVIAAADYYFEKTGIHKDLARKLHNCLVEGSVRGNSMPKEKYNPDDFNYEEYDALDMVSIRSYYMKCQNQNVEEDYEGRKAFEYKHWDFYTEDPAFNELFARFKDKLT